MNKNVVVIYFGDDWHKDAPFTSEYTRTAFEDWHRRGQEIGINFFRASIQWYDMDQNIFTKYWAFRDGKWQKCETPLKPDLIYDKIAGKRDHSLFEMKMEMLKKVRVFNNPLFRTTFDSKFSQYLVFKEFMSDSYLATNIREFEEVLEKIKTQKVVIKPLHGSGGFGIIIDEKESIERNQIDFPVLVQEFIESTNGIPGFSEKDCIADLRLVYMNHKFVYAISRIAKGGSLFTNFHQGANAVLVPQEKIPTQAIEVVEKIQKKLSQFKEAHYSLDFMFDTTDRPYLVEMNTTPGFDLLYLVAPIEVREKNFNEFIKIV